jgi:hypothetical protein
MVEQGFRAIPAMWIVGLMVHRYFILYQQITKGNDGGKAGAFAFNYYGLIFS